MTFPVVPLNVACSSCVCKQGKEIVSACTSKKLEDSEEVLEGSFAGGARTNKKKYIYILNSL